MAIGVTLAGSVKKGMSREVSFVVFLGPIMARTTSLGWVMEGIILGGILVTRIFFSCPKYSVALKMSEPLYSSAPNVLLSVFLR